MSKLEDIKAGDKVGLFVRRAGRYLWVEATVSRTTPKQIMLGQAPAESVYWRKNGKRVGADTFDTACIAALDEVDNNKTIAQRIAESTVELDAINRRNAAHSVILNARWSHMTFEQLEQVAAVIKSFSPDKGEA